MKKKIIKNKIVRLAELSLKDFMNRRSREMKLSEKDNVGLSSLLSMKN